MKSEGSRRSAVARTLSMASTTMCRRMTNTKELVTTAAELFVQPAYRARFVHEALNKPGRVMARVCHDIENVFQSRFQSGQCKYVEADACLLFTLTGERKVATWGEAMRVVQRGGGGILIIDGSGKCFLAQAEGFPPPRHFGGNA